MKKLFTILLTCTITVSTLITSALAANEDVSPILHTKIFSPEVSKGICTADVMITADEAYNEEDKCLILAAYDKNDNLTGMSSMEIDINLDNFGYLKKSFSFSADKTTKMVRCFLWESLDSMESCADVSTVAISDGEEFKPYVLDSIRTVDMMGDWYYGYLFSGRPFYRVNGRYIYYADINSVVKRINIDTGVEETLLDVNKELERLAEEDDQNSTEDNVYLEGGELEQVFYDEYRDRLMLTIYLTQANESYFYTVNSGELQRIMPKAEYAAYISAALPNNRAIMETNWAGSFCKIIDTSTGIELGDLDLLAYYGVNDCKYINNKFYYVGEALFDGVGLRVNDFNGNDEEIVSVSDGASINGNFCYSYSYEENDIKKYTLSGAEKAGIKSTDIAVRDGISGLEGQFMFTDQGEMIIFNGTTFRILKKNL